MKSKLVCDLRRIHGIGQILQCALIVLSMWVCINWITDWFKIGKILGCALIGLSTQFGGGSQTLGISWGCALIERLSPPMQIPWHRHILNSPFQNDATQTSGIRQWKLSKVHLVIKHFIVHTGIYINLTCLLAKTSSAASLSSSSFSIRFSSSLASPIRSLSLLSTTNIKPVKDGGEVQENREWRGERERERGRRMRVRRMLKCC